MFNFVRKIFKKNDSIIETAGHGEGCGEGSVEIDLSNETHDNSHNLFEKDHIPMNKGKICINNGVNKKFINKDDPIPEGWVLGGIKKNK